MKTFKKTATTFVSIIALTAIAAPAMASDFAALDTDANGEVSFAEYKAAALSQGKTTTLAAQEFTRLAQGDIAITEDEFFLAEALSDQPYALQALPVKAPMPFDPVETVNSVETFEDAPSEMEAIDATLLVQADPPIVEDLTIEDKDNGLEETAKDLSAPVIIEKSMTIDPEVASEIATSESIQVITPMEEGAPDLSDLEPSAETEEPVLESPTTDKAEDVLDDAVETKVDEVF